MISDSTPSTFSWVGGTECDAEEALADGVQRAGADVAVDDADGGERERQQAAAPVMLNCAALLSHQR